MTRAGLEPAIPETKRPQTYVLDRVATNFSNIHFNIILPSTDKYYEWSLPFRIPYKIL
jgi:hypothetical protein